MNRGSNAVFTIIPSATLHKTEASRLYGERSFSGPSSKMLPLVSTTFTAFSRPC